MSTVTSTTLAQSDSVSTEHIIIRPGHCGGKPHLAGHRIKVQHVAVWHERMGLSPDEIATRYGLSLGQVYAALGYYWDHKDQIDADINADREFADKLRAGAPSLLEKVRQRHAADDSLPPG